MGLALKGLRKHFDNLKAFHSGSESYQKELTGTF